MTSFQAPKDFPTKCTTAEVHSQFEEGGWVASYGKQLWDSELVPNDIAPDIVGKFFPADAAVAAERLQEMIRVQAMPAAHALQQVSLVQIIWTKFVGGGRVS